MLLTRKTFSDALIEDDPNFLENQRLRSDILTRERHNYYPFSLFAVFRETFFLYYCVDFNFVLRSA